MDDARTEADGICRPENLPGQVVLVLQGGGALGAYQAGVYQELHEAGIEPPPKSRGKLFSELVLGEDSFDVCNGCGIGERRTRSERGFFPNRHIGYGEGDFCGGASSHSKTATFDGGKMPAHGVHRVDRGATSD